MRAVSAIKRKTTFIIMYKNVLRAKEPRAFSVYLFIRFTYTFYEPGFNYMRPRPRRAENGKP